MLRLRLVHVDAHDHMPIRAWVLDGATHRDLDLSLDGVMPAAPNQDWIDRGLQMQTDQPRGSLTAEFDLLIRPPGGQQRSVAYLRAGAQQAQAAVIAAARQFGGYLATFAAPTLSRIELKLAECCRATAILGAGRGQVVLSQPADGKLLLRLELLAAHPDDMVVASAPVTEISPGKD